MRRLLIGNRAYSSWSLRGWLACRQAGLSFEVELVPLYADDWEARRMRPDMAVSGGRLPILWDGSAASWNALGIIDHLEQIAGGGRFWPESQRARAFIHSICAEMQSSYMPLRQHCPMNMRRHYPDFAVPPAVEPDIARIDALWSDAVDRFGGPWLAGADYGAADIMFAPIASRFTTYDIPLSPKAEEYRQRAMTHPWLIEWLTAARDEPWVLPHNER